MHFIKTRHRHIHNRVRTHSRCRKPFGSCSPALPLRRSFPGLAMIIAILVLLIQVVFPIRQFTLVVLARGRPRRRRRCELHRRTVLVPIFTFVEIEPVAVVERHDLSPGLNLPCLHLAGLLVHWQHVWVDRLATTERKRAEERSEALVALRRGALAVIV